MEQIIKRYKKFKHDINYRDGYFRKAMIVVLIMLLIDLLILYLVW